MVDSYHPCILAFIMFSTDLEFVKRCKPHLSQRMPITFAFIGSMALACHSSRIGMASPSLSFSLSLSLPHPQLINLWHLVYCLPFWSLAVAMQTGELKHLNTAAPGVPVTVLDSEQAGPIVEEMRERVVGEFEGKLDNGQPKRSDAGWNHLCLYLRCVCLSVLSVCLFGGLFVCGSLSVLSCLSVCLACLLACLSVCLVCRSCGLSICLSVDLSVWSVCLVVCPLVCVLYSPLGLSALAVCSVCLPVV